MREITLLQAFATHNAKPGHRGRSARTQDGSLVISCWYNNFKSRDADVLRYEEDLSRESGEVGKALRAHLAEAKADECDVHPIIAVPSSRGPAAAAAAPTGASYYPRKDLVGRLAKFDGERFVIDFRRMETETELPPEGKKRGARRHV